MPVCCDCLFGGEEDDFPAFSEEEISQAYADGVIEDEAAYQEALESVGSVACPECGSTNINGV